MLIRAFFPIVLVASLGLAPLGGATCGDHGTPETMLVRTAWTEEHLQDKDVVLLAVGKKEEYLAAHIPGSRYLDFSDLSTPAPPAESNAMILEIPPPERVEETLSKAGVRNSSHIVLYSTGGNATMTARAYLTLDAMGLGASSSILDGGLPLWQHEGRLVTQEVPAVPPGSLKLCPRNDVVADLDYVRSQVRKPNAVIVDARLPEFYSGEKIPAQRRAGHIPGAVNVPYSSLLDENGRMLAIPALRDKFAQAGAHAGDQVITYCHIGQQASLAYFAARYVGYDARMFDGSWQEWSAHSELPAEKSPAKTPKQ